MKTIAVALKWANKFYMNILVAMFSSLILVGCEKSDQQIKRLPSTPEEIAESIKNSQRIGKESAIIVNNAILKAFNHDEAVDPEKIATNIELIEGVFSATPTSSGTGIVVQQKDSTYSNIIIVTKDDDRMFKETTKKSSNGFNIAVKRTNSIASNPNGCGKALILAPFQSSFNTDIEKISGLFESIGYIVDEFLNGDATLDRFRGNFLNDYDIIYISTHGLADGRTWGGKESTLLLTGEERDNATFNSLTSLERNALAANTYVNGKAYYAISVPWLNLTTDENFTNSWVFADACESANIDEGTTSLSEAFLDLGAGGYCGYDFSVSTLLANPVAITMTKKFSSGLSFSEASDEVRSDPLLLAISWVPRVIIPLTGLWGEEFNVASFDDNQLNAEPYFLFPTVTDIEGNAYKTVNIGTQVWMAENLKTTKFNDGSEISQVTDGTDWYNLKTPGFCWYKNDEETYKNTYGAFYNWYAVNTEKLCPTGWHVPTVSDLSILEEFLISHGYNYDGSTTGNKIAKSLASTSGWKASDDIGDIGNDQMSNNKSGFTALPVGIRFEEFVMNGEKGFWWSTALNKDSTTVAIPFLDYTASPSMRWAGTSKSAGIPIRCVID